METISKRKRTFTSSLVFRLILLILMYAGMVGAMTFLYRNTLFRILDGTTATQSLSILSVIVVGTSIIGFFLTTSETVDLWSIFLSILHGFCVYTLIAYIDLIPTLIGIVMTVSGILAAGYWVMVLIPTIDRPERRRAILLKRFWRGLCVAYRLMMTGAVVISGFLMISGAFHIGAFVPNTAAEIPTREQSITIDSEMDTLVKLEVHTWPTLSAQERLDVLQVVANIEAAYLGLPHELKVVVGREDDSNTLAYYADHDHTIHIMLHHLSKGGGKAVLRSICHEARHAYQHRLVSLYKSLDKEQQQLLLFNACRQYQYEFLHYVDGKDDMKGYAEQRCETDARRYAETAAARYADQILAYLKETKEDTSSSET